MTTVWHASQAPFARTGEDGGMHVATLAAIAASVALLGATGSSHGPPSRATHAAGPNVAIDTSDGTIVVHLEPKRAPKTVANFLRYVDARAYDGASFYRTVSRASEPQAPFEVIQGGFGPQSGPKANPPVVLEPTDHTRLHNADGAIAMARTNDPDSATSEFFIDLGDAKALDAGGPLGAGYAVFGRVTRGMAIVRRIHGGAAQGETLSPPVTISRIHRL